MRNKIFVFTSAHRWNDTRIFKKQLFSLSAKYKVEYHAPASFRHKEINGIHIFGLPNWKSKFFRIYLNLIIFYRLIKSNSDIYHFHDPELIFLGIYLKKIKKRVVIYDIHEDYSLVPYTRSWIPKILKNILSQAINYLELNISKKFDLLICATPHIKNRFNNKSIVVQNFPKVDKWEKIENKIENKQILYYGDITSARGINEIINAVDIVNNKIKVKLILIGKISEKKLNKNISLGIKNGYVEYHQWMDQCDLQKIAKKCNIGLSILKPVPAYIDSYPVKVFEYMAMGLPILASNFTLWRQIIEEEGCGKVCNPIDINDISRKIIYMFSNIDELGEMGKKGLDLVKIKYNWINEEKKLLESYFKLCNHE